MRNIMKAATIESKFPLLAVEHDCIISKDADITVAFKVELPELFTDQCGIRSDTFVLGESRKSITRIQCGA